MIDIHFCIKCGHSMTKQIPVGDNRERSVCKNCQHIHYLNPLNVVGTIPYWQDKVLLCRRAIEPRYGYWTLPAGFMELGETIEQAAIRETQEESGANVTLGNLFSLLTVPHVGQVHVFFLAEMLSADFDPGEESLAVMLVKEEDVPWEDIAFTTVYRTLKNFFEAKRKNILNKMPVIVDQVTQSQAKGE